MQHSQLNNSTEFIMRNSAWNLFSYKKKPNTKPTKKLDHILEGEVFKDEVLATFDEVFFCYVDLERFLPQTAAGFKAYVTPYNIVQIQLVSHLGCTPPPMNCLKNNLTYFYCLKNNLTYFFFLFELHPL